MATKNPKPKPKPAPEVTASVQLDAKPVGQRLFYAGAAISFLVSLVVWVAAVTFTGYVSIASILAALVFPVAARFVLPDDVYTFGLGLILAAFIVFTHRTNIRRLALGTENRFGKWRVGAS